MADIIKPKLFTLQVEILSIGPFVIWCVNLTFFQQSFRFSFLPFSHFFLAMRATQIMSLTSGHGLTFMPCHDNISNLGCSKTIGNANILPPNKDCFDQSAKVQIFFNQGAIKDSNCFMGIVSSFVMWLRMLNDSD